MLISAQITGATPYNMKSILKNRLPHQALPGYITPFQCSHSRVFVGHVTVKQSHVRKHKIDESFTTTGIFLMFTATDRTIWFKDSSTSDIKSARHVIFDEAHYSSDNHPP